MKTTTLSDSFSYENYVTQYGDDAIPLFMLNGKNRLLFFGEHEKTEPKSGWKIVAMVRPESTAVNGAESA